MLQDFDAFPVYMREEVLPSPDNSFVKDNISPGFLRLYSYLNI